MQSSIKECFHNARFNPKAHKNPNIFRGEALWTPTGSLPLHPRHWTPPPPSAACTAQLILAGRARSACLDPLGAKSWLCPWLVQALMICYCEVPIYH